MKNYEYIVASLPVILQDTKGQEGLDVEEIVSSVRSLLGSEDNGLVDILEEGFNQEEGHSEEFYRKALSSKDRFLREYFNFDLALRNAKVRYLNKALGRPEDLGLFMEARNLDEIEEMPRIVQTLEGTDILEREKGIDDILWKKIEELTTFDYFDMDAILGTLAKMNIVGRWLRLDPNTGKEMFKKLVEEVKGTYTGVKFEG